MAVHVDVCVRVCVHVYWGSVGVREVIVVGNDVSVEYEKGEGRGEGVKKSYALIQWLRGLISTLPTKSSASRSTLNSVCSEDIVGQYWLAASLIYSN